MTERPFGRPPGWRAGKDESGRLEGRVDHPQDRYQPDDGKRKKEQREQHTAETDAVQRAPPGLRSNSDSKPRKRNARIVTTSMSRNNRKPTAAASPILK